MARNLLVSSLHGHPSAGVWDAPTFAGLERAVLFLVRLGREHVQLVGMRLLCSWLLSCSYEDEESCRHRTVATAHIYTLPSAMGHTVDRG